MVPHGASASNSFDAVSMAEILIFTSNDSFMDLVYVLVAC